MADFAEILREIGEFGRFQKLNLVALSFPNVVFTLLFSSVILVPSDLQHRCNTDWILEGGANLSLDLQLNLTLPRDPGGAFSSCEMFVPVDWDVQEIMQYGLNQTTPCLHGWVYQDPTFDSTIVTSFNLVCGQENLVGGAQSTLMAGILLGCLVFGPPAESFGRRRATQVSVVLMMFSCVATALCPNVVLYLGCQLLVGLSCGGYRVNSIILATEWSGTARRSWGAGLAVLSAAAGQWLMVLLAFFVRDWRTSQLVMALPSALVCVYIWFIPESARWLLSRGRTPEAEHWILKVAAINGRTVTPELLQKVPDREAEEEPKTPGALKTLLTSGTLRRNFCAVALTWFSLTLSYYGLSFSAGTLGLDVLLTILMFGVTEVLAHLLSLWLLETLGRRRLLLLGLLAAGLLGASMLAVPQDDGVAVTSLAVAIRFFLSVGLCVCYVFAQELFPTCIRQSAVGLAMLAGRFGGVASALVNMLAAFHWSAPVAVMAALVLLSAALGTRLPETRGTKLPDSLQEAEGEGSTLPCSASTRL